MCVLSVAIICVCVSYCQEILFCPVTVATKPVIYNVKACIHPHSVLVYGVLMQGHGNIS